MKRSQLNVSIDPTLLEQVKQSARVSGKSLVTFVSDCFVNQIENLPVHSMDSRFQMIEERLHSIEKELGFPIDQSQNRQSFTTAEVENFNEFIKAIFRKELERKGYVSIKEAWNDLINHISCFEQWDEKCSFRLKESIFIEHADPLTGDEINHLREGEICPQPIRTGLINWINNSDRGKCCCSDNNFPSQEKIFEKGSNLVEEIYS